MIKEYVLVVCANIVTHTVMIKVYVPVVCANRVMIHNWMAVI